MSTEVDRADDAARRNGVVLFTAFEPSGDAHAAPVIAALREARPDLRICAWGGPRMEEAGATVIERSADHGAMGLNAVAHANRVRGYIRAIKRWSKTFRVLVHVPVDSPAANFPICRPLRQAGSRVVHLVAPQLWAWGPWRIRKLRGCTDLVLCLLPFEEEWFRHRDVPARFIGHPRINRTLDDEALAADAARLPQGGPRIGIFPGSRSHEVKANSKLLVRAFMGIRERHNNAVALVAAGTEDIAEKFRRAIGEFPTGLHSVVGRTDAVITWSELCLAVSGTITLDIARQHRPMIGVYKNTPAAWAVAKGLLRTPYRLLPNVIADSEIVTEFVPHPSGPAPIIRAATEFLTDSHNAVAQEHALRQLCGRFSGKKPAQEAAGWVLRVLDGETVEA